MFQKSKVLAVALMTGLGLPGCSNEPKQSGKPESLVNRNGSVDLKSIEVQFSSPNLPGREQGRAYPVGPAFTKFNGFSDIPKVTNSAASSSSNDVPVEIK